MRLKPIITWAVVIFIAFYLITQPTAGGHAIHAILAGIKSAGNSLHSLLQSI